MISPKNERKDSPMKLLPHQANFVDTFFNPGSKRVILLRGDVGLGKSAALIALASRLLRERPIARVLILVPSALASHFAEKLQEAGTPNLFVDRYRFREMLDIATEGELWPRGMVAVLSRDFAKQPDIRDSLAKTSWELVIVDEAHSLGGARAEAIRLIGDSAERMVFATATPTEIRQLHLFSAKDATIVEWRRDQVVNHDGSSLDVLPRPLWQDVPFSLTQAELNLFEKVAHLCRIIKASTPPQGWIVNLLKHTVLSSPAVLEQILQRLTERASDKTGIAAPTGFPDDEISGERPGRWIDLPTADEVSDAARHTIQAIEEIDRDSKLEAFSELLGNLKESDKQPRWICVLTDYLSTLYYLAAEIEDRGRECNLLYGGMGFEDRHQALDLFFEGKGVLVATRAIISEGIDLYKVTDLVLYDVPGNKVALQQVLGRFNRFGRLHQLTIHVLAPSNSSNDFITQSSGLLREIYGELSKDGKML